MVIESHSPEQTEAIARGLSSGRDGPLCITLTGELGAGKTRFVRGLVQGWGGSADQVSSPTYVLINRYHTPRGSIFHLDAYRLSGPDDLEAIGFEELLDQPAMVVIEWPQRLEEMLPERRLEVSITVRSESLRTIRVDDHRNLI